MVIMLDDCADWVCYRIETALDQEDIENTKLIGDMDRVDRGESLECFRTDPGCNVLLASIYAAGVGIDLRCAQNVYLMVCLCFR